MTDAMPIQRTFYRYSHNGQIVECTDLRRGRTCSSGIVVKQGAGPKGEPMGAPVGHTSDSWANFESAGWTPTTFPEAP